MIVIGLPKGSVKKNSLGLVSKILNAKVNEKELSFRNDKYTIMLLKHRDIPRFLEKGLIDIGITSDEWVEEYGVKFNRIDTLDWCNTRISLIGKINMDFQDGISRCKIITEFPNIASKYIQQKKIQCDLFYVSGSSEACVPEMFDFCIDCVETGKTLIDNNLEEKEVIMHSQIAIFAKDDLDICRSEIYELINIIKKDSV